MTSIPMRSVAAQGRYLLGTATSILVGLDDSHRALLPKPGANTAGWLIGHLAVTGDFGLKLCGGTRRCPKPWYAMFNPETKPSLNPETYPPMLELTEAFRSVYADLASAAEVADAAVLASPNLSPFTRDKLPTAGEFVVYLLTGHLGYHLGQLRTWRAAAGL